MLAYEDFVAPGTWILEGLPTPPPGLERYAPLGQHDSRSVGEVRFPSKPLPCALREKILEGSIFAPHVTHQQQPDCDRQGVDDCHPEPDCRQQDSDEVGSLSTGCSSSSSSRRRDRPRKSCRTLSDSGASTSSTLSLRSSHGKGLDQASTSQCSPLPIHHAVSHHLVEPDDALEFDSSVTSHRREWLQPETRKPCLHDLPQLPMRHVKKNQRPREVSGSSFSALGLAA